MYAAAGGASCRQARKRQAQQASKDKAAAAKALKEKLAHSKVNLAATPTKSKQFHQLPATYLRTPYSGVRKLSAGYTGHSSKLLLPINEQSAQQHSPSHQLLSSCHHHQQQQHARTPTFGHQRELRLDVEHKTLTKSATASFPLVSQASTPPASPIGTTNLCPFHHLQHYSNNNNNTTNNNINVKESQSNLLSVQVPPLINDGIIITPATPIPSPGAGSKADDQQQDDDQQQLRTSLNDLHKPKIVDDLPDFPLGRACSVYRNRKLEAEDATNETVKVNIATDELEEHQKQQFFIGTLPNGNTTTSQPWIETNYYDPENQNCIECAQGRQAWLERGRRCSVQDPNQASYHRRWVKGNRVQDASLGGSSDDEDLLGIIRGPSSFANAFLYIGLGTISLGSIIFFVGTGEKGFKTQELRLIGPALAIIGAVFCIIRIMFCVCPSHCISKRERNKKNAKVDADHRTSLLGDTKRVSIARGPYINSKIPMSSSQSSQFPPKSIVKNKSYEGVETLRQIASTSLFLDKEQKSNGLGASGGGMCQTIPTIKEPTDEGSSNASLINLMPHTNDAILEPPIEMMMKMDTLKVDTLNVIDILSLTDSETDREIHQIDINQEVVIPRIEPTSLFNDDYDNNNKLGDVGDINELVDDESQLDSDGNKRSKLHRQRTSLNQSKLKDADTLLMETSLMIIDPAPLSPPPFSPPPLPISPNIITTTFKIPSTLSLTLPLTNTTTSMADEGVTSSEQQQQTTQISDAGGGGGTRRHRSHHHHSHHHHSHHHKSSHHKHRHSSRTDERGHAIKDSHQITEAELVLSPSKLGQ